VLRRDFLSVGALSAGALSTRGAAFVTDAASGRDTASAQASAAVRDQAATGVAALTFDVFGTVVDWRASIIREGQLLTRTRGVQADWAAFADRWRAGYGPAMNRVRTGELPWTRIDDLHRMVLDELLVEVEIRGLSEAEIDHLNRAWHRLTPWPDALAGLHRLKSRFTIATLSNGNVSLLTNMAKNGGLPWDVVLSAELMGHYKPDPEVYLGAAKLLDLPPSRVMMVAAHRNDLAAAREVGLRTALVHRPLEYGPDREVDLTPDARFDHSVMDFLELADRLGA
jgi:2-haloacid dehalogenase